MAVPHGQNAGHTASDAATRRADADLDRLYEYIEVEVPTADIEAVETTTSTQPWNYRHSAYLTHLR